MNVLDMITSITPNNTLIHWTPLNLQDIYLLWTSDKPARHQFRWFCVTQPAALFNHTRSPKLIPHPSALATPHTMATKIKDCEILKTHHHYSSSPVSLDFAERYLADVVVIDQLINVKEISALEAIMTLWSDLRLYTVGLASPGHWKIVEKHFPSRTEQPTFGCKTLNFRPGKKGWQQLPDEIRTRVFKHFDIRDITAMAGTRPYYCSYFADIMRDFFESSFEQWALNWMTVKVMLYHTDALISGPTANALMHPYRSVPDSSIIDFYVSSHTLFGMLGYFTVATEYVPHKNSVKYPAEIQIHVSSRENPRASVIRQQLTGLFAYVCAQGFRYPDLTLNAFAHRQEGMTLTNHEYIPIECVADIEELKKLDRQAKRCDLQLREYHFGVGVCGENLTCPSVVRSTWKDSLFLVPFCELLWVRDEQSRAEKYVVTWCLGPMGCEESTCAVDFIHVAPIEPRDIQQESYLTYSFEDGPRAIPAKPKTVCPDVQCLVFPTNSTTAKFMNINQHMLIGNKSSTMMAQRLAWYRLMPSYRTTGMEVPNFDDPHTKSSLFILFTFPYAIIESPTNRAIMNLLEVQWYGNVVVVKKSGDHLEDCTPEDIMSAIECVGKLMDRLGAHSTKREESTK
ncbi:hypothetical protein FB451DRAFT_1190120 [Mycena latifolia]|nr:hypothetical protein FB451DRAFT_1190120 [Mycena latifolia]